MKQMEKMNKIENFFFYNCFYLFIFFISYRECKFLSFIKSNDVKANVTFISMSRIAETRLVTNSTLLNISVSHQSQCMNKCTKTTNCTSYNTFKDSQNVNVQCQLLSENKYSNSNQLEKKVGWTHVSIQSVPCERSPCKNSGTCIPDYAENDFLCVCSEKYLGEFCETELTKIISLPLNNLGCWKDNLNRAMVTLEGSSTILDGSYQTRLDAVKKCNKAARERGFAIFAVQDGGYCSASNDNLYTKYGLSNACKNDGKGSVMSNQVYISTEKLLYKYVGCWRDYTVHRAGTSLEGLASVLMDSYLYRLDAIAKCYTIATELQYDFFTIQDGGQCFAGYGISYQMYGTANNCRAGGKGGNSANDVYIINF
nr:uncharacterized protein LOC105844648 isoform X2 [Hydra vulgaris]